MRALLVLALAVPLVGCGRDERPRTVPVTGGGDNTPATGASAAPAPRAIATH